MPQQLSAEEHRQQIEAYLLEFPHYTAYAKALDRVLNLACAASISHALVQARAKSVSSFAEKCVRKFHKYHDPVHQLTDLCGARVVVHTLEQVKAVRLFIEHNFIIVERDDKGLLLSDDKFGYRDMHYLVRLKPERAQPIGFSAAECETIGKRLAELQVRSMVQHAWADILHDRMYKTPLRLSAEARRTGALLAAIMEEGDRSFDRLAVEIDGIVANYAAYANRAEVHREIEVQELILKNERDARRRAGVALLLARLLGPCGEYARVIEILTPFTGSADAPSDALLLELGHALCRVHRGAPDCGDYKRGQDYLDRVVARCSDGNFTVVPDLRKMNSLRARALARLAWSWEAVPFSEGKARDCYRKALESEPANPYHLANQLGFEIFCERGNAMIGSIGTNIRLAVATCREHAEAGTELPYAHFTAGRLSLLLGDAAQALNWYARGLRHLFDGKSCVSADVLDDEVNWVKRIHHGAIHAPEEHEWIERLIALGRAFCSVSEPKDRAAAGTEADRFLIIAGGAGSMNAEMLQRIRPCLEKALENFRGTAISGGTSVGVPGCVGELAAELKAAGRKHFELAGYIPKQLPENAPKDLRYDRFVVVSEDTGFSPGEILRTWEDLLRDGVTPERVTVLGFGGGPLSSVEYHVALALGASVAVVADSGGGADMILADPVWNAVPSLLALPLDPASVQALVTTPTLAYATEKLEEMARCFHGHYVKDNLRKLPDNLRPWEKLSETFRTANIEQARYAVEILRASGFEVRAATGRPEAIASFAGDTCKADVERMAELEHGRWNIERLRNGWRFGPSRDDAKKIHNCLVTWEKLPDDIREYDRNAIRAIPEILAKAGMEVYRR